MFFAHAGRKNGLPVRTLCAKKNHTHKIAEVRNKKWPRNSDHSEFLCIYVYLYPSRDTPTYARLSTHQNICLVWKTVWVDIKEFSENRDDVQGQNELQNSNSLVHLPSWVDGRVGDECWFEGGTCHFDLQCWHIFFSHFLSHNSDKNVQPYYSALYEYFKSNLYRTGEESRATEVGRLLIIFFWFVLIGFPFGTRV
jgi:hypothetical protein